MMLNFILDYQSESFVGLWRRSLGVCFYLTELHMGEYTPLLRVQMSFFPGKFSRVQPCTPPKKKAERGRHLPFMLTTFLETF